jgi:hypothetical protein
MSSALATSATVSPQPLPSHVIILKSPRKGPRKEQPMPASRQAQRVAAAILEVLAGVRTPLDAAAALDIAPPRYYLLEQRALEGLVAACEPRLQGRGQNPRRQIAALEKEIERLKQDCTRQQSLVRAAQRTIGLAPSPAAEKPVKRAGPKAAGKKLRKRRPVVRALKAVATLRTEAPPVDETDSSGTIPQPVLQPMDVNHPSLPITSSPTDATMTAG